MKDDRTPLRREDYEEPACLLNRNPRRAAGAAHPAHARHAYAVNDRIADIALRNESILAAV